MYSIALLLLNKNFFAVTFILSTFNWGEKKQSISLQLHQSKSLFTYGLAKI